MAQAELKGVRLWRRTKTNSVEHGMCRFIITTGLVRTAGKSREGLRPNGKQQSGERHFRMKEAAELDMTFEDFVKAIHKRHETEAETQYLADKRAYFADKAASYFKDKKMRDIRPKDIIQWQNEQISYRDEKGKPYAPTYLKTLQSELSALFNHAVRFYELKSNPVVKAGPLGKGKAEEMLFGRKKNI